MTSGPPGAWMRTAFIKTLLRRRSSTGWHDFGATEYSIGPSLTRPVSPGTPGAYTLTLPRRARFHGVPVSRDLHAPKRDRRRARRLAGHDREPDTAGRQTDRSRPSRASLSSPRRPFIASYDAR